VAFAYVSWVGMALSADWRRPNALASSIRSTSDGCQQPPSGGRNWNRWRLHVVGEIKNPEYSQMAGRRELFEARRDHRQLRRRDDRKPCSNCVPDSGTKSGAPPQTTQSPTQGGQLSDNSFARIRGRTAAATRPRS